MDWKLVVRLLRVPWTARRSVNPKGNQPRIFIGRTDAEIEPPVLWPPDARSRFIGKDPDAEKYWRQEEEGTTENEMVGWHQGITYSVDVSLSKLLEIVKDREDWHAAVCGVTKNRTWLSDWTTKVREREESKQLNSREGSDAIYKDGKSKERSKFEFRREESSFLFWKI